MAETKLRLGDMGRQLERFTVALRWYRSALTDGRRLHDSRICADAQLGQAMVMRGQGKYGEAIRKLRVAANRYRAVGDREGIVYSIWAIGTTARFAGDLVLAERSLSTSVRLYRALGDESGLAYALCGLGGTLRMLDRPLESQQAYAMARRHFLKVKDGFGIAYSSCGTGNALRMQGKFSAALPFMNQAVSSYKKLKLYGPLGFVLWSRAQVGLLTGRISAARSDLAASGRAFRKARDPRGLVYVTIGMGELERAEGKSGSVYYRKALMTAKRLGLRLEGLHAAYRLGKVPISAYSKIGIRTPAYLNFSTLP